MPFALLGVAETAVTDAQNLVTTLTGFGLDHGTFTSLDAKLNVVLAGLSAGDTASTCSGLNDFINQVTAQSGKKLTADQASTLITAARRIQTLVGC
jgi:hypothetical protein